MRIKVPTKEELIAKVATLEVSVKSYQDSDEVRRTQFARAFEWFKDGKMYDWQERSVEIPSWAQIFVNTGHLLAQRDFKNNQDIIREMRIEIEELKRSLPTLNQ